MLTHLLRETRQQIAAQISVAHFAAPELDRHLDPIAQLRELDCATNLGVEVTLTDLYFEPYLFELDRPLMAAGLLFATSLLVLELSVIEEASDRRGRRW